MRKFVGPAAVAVALSIGAPGSHGLTLDYKTITTKFDVDVAAGLSVEEASAFARGAAGAPCEASGFRPRPEGKSGATLINRGG